MTAVLGLTLAIVVIALYLYMRAQKSASTAQQLIHQHRYEDAVAAADRGIDRGDALKLLGRFDEAIAAYKTSDDPAAREGIALSLAHLERDLDEAARIMEATIATFPQILEFQALALAYIYLRAGRRDDALRLYDDNVVLLQTRFRDDYTDPDPMLAETLWLYGELAFAAGDAYRSVALKKQAAEWAPGSVWAR